MTPKAALKKAVKTVGSQNKLAGLLGVQQPSVWGWLNKGTRLPAEHVLKIEEVSGVSRHDLRPDIYPRETA